MQFTAVVLSAHVPNYKPFNIGVLVIDEVDDRAYLRSRTDFGEAGASADLEVLREFPAMLESMAEEWPSKKLLLWLESTASNAIRLSDRVIVEAGDAEEAADQLAARHLR